MEKKTGRRYLTYVLLHGQLGVELDAQISNNRGRDDDLSWSRYGALGCVVCSDWLSTQTRWLLSCQCLVAAVATRTTVRHQRHSLTSDLTWHARHIIKSTAVVQLSIVGVQVQPCLMSVDDIHNILGVSCKLNRSEDRALRDTAVNLDNVGLLFVVHDCLRTAVKVRLEPAESCICNVEPAWQDIQQYVMINMSLPLPSLPPSLRSVALFI